MEGVDYHYKYRYKMYHQLTMYLLNGLTYLIIIIKEVRVMVFNATFNDISVISLRYVLLKETGENLYCIDYTLP